MLKTNRFLKRLAAMTLALLLLLCAGCGSAPAPASGTPAPSQEPGSPAAEQPPEPASASSPTDVNAPATQLPAPEISIEREAPESIHFLTQGLHFTAANADGQTFSYNGAEGSGNMLVDHWKITEPTETIPKTFYCQPEYSDRFTCELTAAPEESEEWAIELFGTTAQWYHCVVNGSGGKPESFEYDYLDSRLTVRCQAGTKLELTLAVPDSVLGQSGWIRLMAISAGGEIVLRADGNTLTFSGLDPAAPDPNELGLSPEHPAILNYGGSSSGQLIVQFSSGSGTLDLSGLLGGNREITAAPAEG